MKPNPGHLPDDAIGKRVIVGLRNGSVCGRVPVTATAPLGWDAKQARWSLTGQPHDIAQYEVIP
ncbi:MAG: hypothetical protein IT472_08960 [Thermomonas sp.]|uniref:hypothetical protein n=1 Tax=Thermomonas sp. TaxID=1971895 RepID=UPI002625AC82|nr:hypothetical protein [Thermomonas sp.]MCC7097295.1 hypothetical protein [Thermomonas sp.]